MYFIYRFFFQRRNLELEIFRVFVILLRSKIWQRKRLRFFLFIPLFDFEKMGKNFSFIKSKKSSMRKVGNLQRFFKKCTKFCSQFFSFKNFQKLWKFSDLKTISHGAEWLLLRVPRKKNLVLTAKKNIHEKFFRMIFNSR